MEITQLPDDPRELANYYRTCWLMAVHRLHELAHPASGELPSVEVEDAYVNYLLEVARALEVSRKPA